MYVYLYVCMYWITTIKSHTLATISGLPQWHSGVSHLLRCAWPVWLPGSGGLSSAPGSGGLSVHASQLNEYSEFTIFWLHHLTFKIVPKIAYNVSNGMLNPTIPYHFCSFYSCLPAQVMYLPKCNCIVYHTTFYLLTLMYDARKPMAHWEIFRVHLKNY